MTRQGVCITASVAALVAMAVMVAFAGAVPANVSGGVSGYTGAEGNAPASFPTPKMKPGFKCTIGYMNPLAANEALQWDQKGAEAEAKALGCKMITLDDALSVDKQVSHMQQLLAEKVNAIIFY